MSDEIKVYYTKLRNMGDQLNELILEKCFGYQAVRTSFLDGELCAIGSCLGMYTPHGTVPMRIRQRVNGIRKPHVWIWGTGFINYSEPEGQFFKKHMEFCAVRGELTRKRVEQIMGKKLDIPTGDPGLLASEVLEKEQEKRYEVGIIPHLCDLRDPKIEELIEKYSRETGGSTSPVREETGVEPKEGADTGRLESRRPAGNPRVRLISVKDEPLEVIREIAECRYILSSSLHGLIVADSLGIPNMHIVFGDRLLGDGYKFDDYYSAFGVEHCPCDLRTNGMPELAEIEDGYRICPEMVAEKKKALREAFPFPAGQRGRLT